MTALAASFDARNLGLSPPRPQAWPPRLAWLWLPTLASEPPESLGAVRTSEGTADGADDDDAGLAARACRGDSRAFEKLIRRHHAMIHRVAWRQTGFIEEAEDIVQTVLMQLVEKLASYRGQARFTTWLRGSKKPERKKVSQVLWCLERITQGVCGMFSMPPTR